MSTQSIRHYSTVTQALHWLTAILVLIAFIYGPGGSEARVYAPARDFERQLHETLGICVLALVLLRLMWRIYDKRPAPAPGAPWMKFTATLVKRALYCLLFLVPLSAITGAWLDGHALTLLFGIQIQPPVAAYHATGELIAEIHTVLGDAILWVAGLHAAAGLYHHFALKDDVLRSMLPNRHSSKNR